MDAAGPESVIRAHAHDHPVLMERVLAAFVDVYREAVLEL
jgi:hypothetical protein